MEGELREETYGGQGWHVTGRDATCEDCGAKYFAWIADSDGRDRRLNEDGFYDLSYRSSFNDEPGIDDIPTGSVVVRYERIVEVGGKEIRRTEAERPW